MDGFDIGQSLQNGLDIIIEWLPNLIGALLILIIGQWIASLLRTATTKALQRLGFNGFLMGTPARPVISKVTDNPSQLAGTVVFWLAYLGVISLALSVLEIEALTAFVGAIYSYLPNVLAAILIFVVAAVIAGGVAAFVDRVMGDTPTGQVVETVVPVVVMGIAGFMILNQLGIAPEIVNITYTAIVGAVALGMALAFGLGGRDVAGRILESAYQNGQGGWEQAKHDIAKGRERAKPEVERAKNKNKGKNRRNR